MDVVDKRYLKVAEIYAKWSPDPNTKVGAVLVSQQGTVIGKGCNCFPHGIAEDERLFDRVLKNEMVVHAEPNAILNALNRRERVAGSTLYLTTAPCCRCTGIIIQAKIRRVVWLKPSEDFLTRWGESVKLSRNLLWEAGIEHEETEL